MQLQFLTIFPLVLGYGASLPTEMRSTAHREGSTVQREGSSGRSVSAWPAGEGGARRRPESTLTDSAGTTKTAPVTHALYETCLDQT